MEIDNRYIEVTDPEMPLKNITAFLFVSGAHSSTNKE